MIVMTVKDLVNDLMTLESRPTFYKNVYPYNLLYVHNNGYTSADCVNLYKALFNGYDINNRTAGYFQKPPFYNTGDVGGWELLQQCTDISQDFSKLKTGEPRLLYMQHGNDWHVGGYIGEFQKYGKTYNVCECTAAWGGKILFSYVDSKGNRYKSKGGEMRKSWTHHGLMTKWVDYSEYYDELDGDFYTVKSGDKLSKIANKFNTTTDEIIKINNMLLAGQKLKVK